MFKTAIAHYIIDIRGPRWCEERLHRHTCSFLGPGGEWQSEPLVQDEFFEPLKTTLEPGPIDPLSLPKQWRRENMLQYMVRCATISQDDISQLWIAIAEKMKSVMKPGLNLLDEDAIYEHPAAEVTDMRFERATQTTPGPKWPRVTNADLRMAAEVDANALNARKINQRVDRDDRVA